MPKSNGTLYLDASIRDRIRKALSESSFRTHINNLGYKLESMGAIGNSVGLYSHIEEDLIDSIASYAMKTGKIK